MSALATPLIASIRREHQLAQDAFQSAVEHAVRCGELLNEAKAQVPHGAWLPWLNEHFPASHRTAQGYMRLARHAADAQALAHLGIEGALRSLAAPAPQRLTCDQARHLTDEVRADLQRMRSIHPAAAQALELSALELNTRQAVKDSA